MSEQSTTTSGCGCGGHDVVDERAAAPVVAQPMAQGYQAEAPAAEGVVPGRKPGNLLGLRDAAATPSSGGGCACGCGGH